MEIFDYLFFYLHVGICKLFITIFYHNASNQYLFQNYIVQLVKVIAMKECILITMALLLWKKVFGKCSL